METTKNVTVSLEDSDGDPLEVSGVQLNPVNKFHGLLRETKLQECADGEHFVHFSASFPTAPVEQLQTFGDKCKYSEVTSVIKNKWSIEYPDALIEVHVQSSE